MNPPRSRRVAAAVSTASDTAIPPAPSLPPPPNGPLSQRQETSPSKANVNSKGVHGAILLLSQFRRAVAKQSPSGDLKDHDEEHDVELLPTTHARTTKQREGRPLLADEGDAFNINYGGRDQRDVSGKTRTFRVRVPKKLLLWTALIFLGLPLLIFFYFEVTHSTPPTPDTNQPSSDKHDDQFTENQLNITHMTDQSEEITTQVSKTTSPSKEKESTVQDTAGEKDNPQVAPIPIKNTTKTVTTKPNHATAPQSTRLQLDASHFFNQKDKNVNATQTAYKQKSNQKTEEIN